MNRFCAAPRSALAGFVAPRAAWRHHRQTYRARALLGAAPSCLGHASRARPEEAAQRIRQILTTFVNPEEAASLKADLLLAFQNTALVPDVLGYDGALTALMDTILAYVERWRRRVRRAAHAHSSPNESELRDASVSIGEPYVAETLHKLVPHLLAKLSKPRAPNADRVEYFAEAEAFAHVVRLDCIAVSGAVVRRARIRTTQSCSSCVRPSARAHVLVNRP